MLIGIATETAEDREEYNLEVKCEAPIAQVVEVIFQPIGNGCVTSESIHLGPARNPNLEIMARIVPGYILQKLLNKVGPFRSRAYDAHVAHEDIPELWQFI